MNRVGIHDMKLDASLYSPVFPPGHFSSKISDHPSIFDNNSIIIKLKLLDMCVYKNGCSISVLILLFHVVMASFLGSEEPSLKLSLLTKLQCTNFSPIS